MTQTLKSSTVFLISIWISVNTRLCLDVFFGVSDHKVASFRPFSLSLLHLNDIWFLGFCVFHVLCVVVWLLGILMADDKTDVLEISSDEDVCWGNGIAGCADGYRDDGDWISELFNGVETRGIRDVSDEVAVVGEVIVNPKSRLPKTSLKCVNIDDDDDCVILDEDPDKPVSIKDDGGGGRVRVHNSDDLLVVSEKGQIACRDYPHARHLCVKFPFKSTPHERHCDQCHCYVCDSLAPCALWSGLPKIGHCHATDKNEFWRAKRRRAKSSPLVVAAPSVSVDKFQTSRRWVLNRPSQQSVSANGSPVCSSGSRNNSKTLTNTRNQVARRYSSDRSLPQLSLQQSALTTSRSDRRHSAAVNAGSQVISPPPFKRSFTVSEVHRCCSNSAQDSQNPSSRILPSLPSPFGVLAGVVPAPRMSTWKDLPRTRFAHVDPTSVGRMLDTANSSTGNCNTAPGQPQIPAQALGSNVNSSTTGPCHGGVPSQNVNGHNPIHPSSPPVHPQSQVSSHPGGNFPLVPPALTQSLISQTSSVPVELVGSGFQDTAHPTDASRQGIPVVNAGRNNNSWQGNPTESSNKLHSNATESDTNWDARGSHDNQPLVEDANKLQTAVQCDEPKDDWCDSQLFNCDSPNPLKFPFDTWDFGNESSFDGMDTCVLDACPSEKFLFFDI